MELEDAVGEAKPSDSQLNFSEHIEAVTKWLQFNWASKMHFLDRTFVQYD